MGGASPSPTPTETGIYIKSDDGTDYLCDVNGKWLKSSGSSGVVFFKVLSTTSVSTVLQTVQSGPSGDSRTIENIANPGTHVIDGVEYTCSLNGSYQPTITPAAQEF